MLNRHARPWIVALGVALVASGARQVPQPARDTGHPLDAATLLGQLEALLGPGQEPHPLGSTAQDALKSRIAERVAALELPLERRWEETCGSYTLCRANEQLNLFLPGTRPEWVLVSAHTDSAPKAPGAGDNGVAVVIGLALAEIWKDRPRERGLWIALDEGEELGLLGAQGLIRHPEFSKVRAVVNLEARGSRGVSQLFRALGDSGDLVAAYGRYAPRPVYSSLADHVFEIMPNDTNLTVFSEAGIPGLDVAFAEGVHTYHQPTDRIENLDPWTVQSHADNAAAMVEALVSTADPFLGRGKQVAFDLGGRLLLHYPVAWNGLLTLIALAGSALSLRRTPFRPGLSALIRQLFFGSILFVLGIALIWTPIPPFIGLSALLGLLCLGCARRPPTDSAAVTTAGLLYGLLGGVLAVIAPGAAYLGLIPALVSQSSRLHLELGRALTIGTTGLLWLPVTYGLVVALGAVAYPLSVLSLVCVLWPVIGPTLTPQADVPMPENTVHQSETSCT